MYEEIWASAFRGRYEGDMRAIRGRYEGDTRDEQGNIHQGFLAARYGYCGMLRLLHMPGELRAAMARAEFAFQRYPGWRQPERQDHHDASWPDPAGDAWLDVLDHSGQLGFPGACPTRCGGHYTSVLFGATGLRLRHGFARVSGRQIWHSAGIRVAGVLRRGHALCWPRRALSVDRPGDVVLVCWLRLLRCCGTIFAADWQAVRTLAPNMTSVWRRDQAIEDAHSDAQRDDD